MVESAIPILPYLEKIDQLGMIEARELEKAIEERPWCSAYRVLLARCHKNEESFSAESKLNLASLYAGDRVVLFDVMHREGTGPGWEVKEEVKEKVKEEVKEELEEIELPEEHVTSFQPESDTSISEAETVEEPELNTEDNAEETPDKRGFKVDFDSVVTYDPTKELKPTEKPVEERVEIPFERIAYNPEVELQKLVSKSDANAIEGKETQKEQDSDAHDFLYWLDHVDESEEKSTLSRESSGQKPESNVDEVSDLLDTFLASKRRTKPELRSFYNAEKKAQESEIDHSELVSESLANLYLRKEMYDKCIETLQKLSLQNPSKSAYFAARIEEVAQQRDQSR